MSAGRRCAWLVVSSAFPEFGLCAKEKSPAGGCRTRLFLPLPMLRQSIFGSVEYWWNGGGLDNVHSSVVAPSPQGLAGAFFPAASDQKRLMKNTATPATVIM